MGIIEVSGKKESSLRTVPYPKSGIGAGFSYENWGISATGDKLLHDKDKYGLVEWGYLFL